MSQSQKACFTCMETCDPTGILSHEGGVSLCAWRHFNTQGRTVKNLFKRWALKLQENWNLASKLLALLGNVFNCWAAAGQSHKVPATFAYAARAAGLTASWSELCLQTCWRENTFWTCINLKARRVFASNHLGHCGRSHRVPYVQFIFCLLKGNMKKDTKVLTTDVVHKCKYSKLSERGELTSLKAIISACQ